MSAAVEEPGVEEFHTFGVDELFFSTTDRKGIIEMSNSVFQRISHYSHDELLGAPHNIIRHPFMPGGAFKLVWDQIEAGLPACAYVKNLAKDGKSYWVLATLMPIGDKYLSVRLAPTVTALRDLSNGLYEAVAEYERGLRANGMSRVEAAEAGAAMIGSELAKLEIYGMTGLTATLLPAEMASRSRLTGGIPSRPEATGALAEILQAVAHLSAMTDEQVEALDPYDELAKKVKASATSTQALLHKLLQLCLEANVAAETVACQAKILVNTAKGLTEMAQRAEVAIDEACKALTSASERIARTRTQIALGRLHTDMVGNFTAELIDGNEPPGAEDAIELLCTALSEGTTRMAVDVLALPVELRRVAELVQAAVESINTFRRWAIQFRNLITREGLWEELGHITPPIDELLNNAFEPLGNLSQTAQDCVRASVPFEPEALYGDLAGIRGALRTHFGNRGDDLLDV